MKYAVPYAYVINDDNDTTPYVAIIEAGNLEEAQQKTKEVIKEEERKINPNDYFEPAIWVKGDEDWDEEGYIIGEPMPIQ